MLLALGSPLDITRTQECFSYFECTRALTLPPTNQHIRSPISDTRSSYYLLWATTSTLLSPQLRNRRVKEEQPNCRKQTLYSRSTTHRKVLNAIIDSIGWSSRWCMDANRGPITAHKSAVIRPHLADVRTYPGVISDTGIISANCRAAPRHALLCTS